MSNFEEPLHRSIAKTRRVRPTFRPQRYSRTQEQSPMKVKLTRWLQDHPWGVVGAAFGMSGLLGYSLGVRL